MTRLLHLDQVAAMTGTSENTLRFWRQKGVGPASAKLGRRIVYRETDVLEWIEEKFAAAEGA